MPYLSEMNLADGFRKCRMHGSSKIWAHSSSQGLKSAAKGRTFRREGQIKLWNRHRTSSKAESSVVSGSEIGKEQPWLLAAY
eukprot:1002559-Rhodomonas_salina.1